MTANTDPWKALMTTYGFTTDEIRDTEITEPYRCDCGQWVIKCGELVEDSDGEFGMGTEHECGHTNDVVEEPERGDDLRALLAKVNALIPSEPDHTSEPTEADGVPAPINDAEIITTSSDDDVVVVAPRRRANTSHANCSHPATKAARAKCRRDRARG